MLNKVSRSLLLQNGLVFFVSLLIFSVMIYEFVTYCLNVEEEKDLWNISEAVIASIESHDDRNHDGREDSMPEILHHTSGRAKAAFDQLALEWFSPNGLKVASFGALEINVPLVKRSAFQHQNQQHALVLTREVIVDSHFLGFLRVASDLKDQDRFEEIFLTALIAASIIAALASLLVVVWLSKQALAPIEQAFQKLQQFTSDASHEFKGPLMAIRTNASIALLLKDGIRAKDVEKFEAILSATNQLIKTTEDLLTLAEGGNIISARHPIDICAYLKTLGLDMQPCAAAKNVKITVSVVPEESTTLTVVASKEDLQHVFGNIVENSIRYSNEKSIVNVAVRKEGNLAVVSVTDNGIGLSESELPLIFDRFWRSDKARSHNQGGNGLGLSIAKEIADKYKATISVQSMQERETIFTVRWPLN